MDMSARLAIRTTALTKSFANNVTAVDGLTLEVPAGTVFGFLGPNGAGKTTTIQLLLGLLQPSGGRAEVLGYDTVDGADRIREHSGALLEHHGLYEQLTAEENLEFYGRVGRVPGGERRQRIRQLLDQMELWERRHDRVGTWSRGMKQKLALARSLIHRPALVFLDEPTAGLDVMAAEAVRVGLASLVDEEGVTVFLTTHNMAEAERLCAQVGVIRDGRLLAVGNPDTLRSDGAVRVEILGDNVTDSALRDVQSEHGVASAVIENGRLVIELEIEREVASLVSKLVEAGVQVEEVRKGKASLEDVFLTLMKEEDGS